MLPVCALVFKNSCAFFVLGIPWFVVFYAPGFVLLVLQFGLRNCWPSGVSTSQLCSSCAFSAFLLCFSVLPLLHFLDSRGRERERVRVKEHIGGDRRRGGEREGERGREQTREIGEIGRGRETEREEGQGRDKEGRERGGKELDKHNRISQFRDGRVGSDQLKHLFWRDGQGGFEQPLHLPRCCAFMGLVC